jgi:phosphinothricin acetyltransferase
MTTIRLAREDDAGDLGEIYAPYVRDSAVSFERAPPDADAFADRIRETLPAHPWLVCEHDGTAAGYAYAGPHRRREAYRWSVESSVYVRDRHHRSGVATGLYESLFALLELQGYCNVYAGTTLPNPPSVGFHRTMGFEPVGVYPAVGYTDGGWHDVQWFSRPIRPRPDDPAPPTPLDALRGTTEREAALAAGLEHVGL